MYFIDSNRNLGAVRDMKTVAIIGGGLTGLLSLRHILKHHSLQPTLFEASSFVGGIWAYDGKANQYGHQHDHHATHPSVYKNLVTNQSKQIMEFPDFEHTNETLPSFFHHSYVLHYLQQFAETFDLWRFIQFNRRVVTVLPVLSSEANSPCRWNVVVSAGTENDSCLNLVFDAVVVCNGHFTKPYIPKIRGFESFRGNSLHSRYYREPDDFAHKTVLVIGASPSGVDISMDLSPIAKKVYLCNRLYQGKPLLKGLPDNVTEVKEISQFHEDGHSLTLVDGNTISVDSVIFTTGYTYDYPFLDEECGISVYKNRVTHLYKHIVNIHHKSMLFVGIPHRVPIFKVMYFQAVYVAKLLAGEVTLPSVEAMLDDQSKDFQSKIDRGWIRSRAHSLQGIAMEYCDFLANECGISRIPDNVRNLYAYISVRRKEDIMNYKYDQLKLEDFG